MKFLFLAFALTLPIHAQAPGVPIFEQSRTGLRTEDLTISKQVEKLLGEGKLMSLDKIENSLKFPTPVPLNLPLRNLKISHRPRSPRSPRKAATESAGPTSAKIVTTGTSTSLVATL